MYSALTYDVMKSYLTSVRDKKIRNGYITLETSLLCDKCKYEITANQTFDNLINEIQISSL